MFDTVFALAHLVILIGILAYAIVSLIAGNAARGVLILVFLAVYYLLVLHKPVLKEIARRKKK